MRHSLGSMGQVILGFRSLLIKLALFVLFAALLAWALGGTLFPRPEVKEFDSIFYSGHRWYWKVSMGGKVPGRDRIAWELMMVAEPSEETPEAVGQQSWVDGVGPLVVNNGLYFAALASHNPNEHWRIERIDDSLKIVEEYIMPDRLAVEQQLARLGAGLPIQDMETIQGQRGVVLDPSGESAENGETE